MRSVATTKNLSRPDGHIGGLDRRFDRNSITDSVTGREYDEHEIMSPSTFKSIIERDRMDHLRQAAEVQRDIFDQQRGAYAQQSQNMLGALGGAAAMGQLARMQQGRSRAWGDDVGRGLTPQTEKKMIKAITPKTFKEELEQEVEEWLEDTI